MAKVSLRPHDSPFDAVIPVTHVAKGPPVIHATGAQLHVYGETRAYTAADARLGAWIRKVARAIGREENPAMIDDLEQEARARLWKLDPSRLDADDEPWLKRTLRMEMRMAARTDRRQSGGRRAVHGVLEDMLVRETAREG